MVVRGAPAIGVSAAMGVALGVKNSPRPTTIPALAAEFEVICRTLAATRPTAVNLFWAIERMQRFSNSLARRAPPSPASATGLIAEAQRMYDEDIAACRTMGAHGARTAAQIRRRAHPLQCRSPRHLRLRHRPRRHPRRRRSGQEDPRLRRRNPPLPAGRAPHRLGTDARRHPHHRHLRQHGRQPHAPGQDQAVVVGADRIAANGDVANKIGTYNVAILAREHGIPFYVAAPGPPSTSKPPTAKPFPSNSARPSKSPTTPANSSPPTASASKIPPST